MMQAFEYLARMEGGAGDAATPASSRGTDQAEGGITEEQLSQPIKIGCWRKVGPGHACRLHTLRREVLAGHALMIFASWWLRPQLAGVRPAESKVVLGLGSGPLLLPC